MKKCQALSSGVRGQGPQTRVIERLRCKILWVCLDQCHEAEQIKVDYCPLVIFKYFTFHRGRLGCPAPPRHSTICVPHGPSVIDGHGAPMLAAIWQIRMSAGKQVPGTVKFHNQGCHKIGADLRVLHDLPHGSVISGAWLRFKTRMGMPFTDVVKSDGNRD